MNRQSIPTDQLVALLEHWKEARNQQIKDDRNAISENLRCAVDVAEILRNVGMGVPKELFK